MENKYIIMIIYFMIGFGSGFMSAIFYLIYEWHKGNLGYVNNKKGGRKYEIYIADSTK